MSHIAFKREVTICLLKILLGYYYPQVTGGRYSGLPVTLRYDGVGHVNMKSTQGQCKVCEIHLYKIGMHLHCDIGKACFDCNHNNLYKTRFQNLLYAFCLILMFVPSFHFN